jgi:hypothetical protein
MVLVFQFRAVGGNGIAQMKVEVRKQGKRKDMKTDPEGLVLVLLCWTDISSTA